MSLALNAEIEQINSILRAKGYRKSKLRDSIICVLRLQKAPISAQEILDKVVDKDLAPNKTSVYRELETLLRENILREVSLMDGKKRYELSSAQDEDHSHLVCTECGQIQCLELDHGLSTVETQIQNRLGFKIKNRILEFFGLCLNCSSEGLRK